MIPVSTLFEEYKKNPFEYIVPPALKRGRNNENILIQSSHSVTLDSISLLARNNEMLTIKTIFFSECLPIHMYSCVKIQMHT